MVTRLLKVRKYQAGYHIHYEEVSGEEAGGGDPFVMRSAYTPEGDYIGSSGTARFLIMERGIKPEKAEPGDNICTVGFCEKDQKWYGWSHRALCGFGVGDKLFEAGWSGATESTPFVAHGDVTISELGEARQAAVNFARSVS